MEPFIVGDDIADLAAALLLDATGGHAGKDYDLSGPVFYTFGQAAEVLSGARGNPFAYVDIIKKKVPVVRLASHDVTARLPQAAEIALAGIAETVREGLLAFTTAAGLVVFGRCSMTSSPR